MFKPHILKQALLLIATTLLISGAAAATEKAIFGGGCFWCMEPPFDKQKGVITTTSGYIGGHLKNPSYQDVSSGQSGHVEVVEIIYDPNVVSYDELLKIYWVNIDPLNSTGQFCDRGSQYLSAIFYLNENQHITAADSLKALKKSKVLKGKIATTIQSASTFYPAEEYHQDYYQKNTLAYRFYRYRCGRDARLKELWPHTPES
ncbi:MAG: peptide-methionine (S)-S-oxide reductase MsrA [Porticoccus sp.]|nr:peptide-methionine (S)-S-oxide reductase MsrA [Porticoccus sp.]